VALAHDFRTGPVFAHSGPHSKRDYRTHQLAIDFARLARFCCRYLEMAKTVFNAGTAAGRDDLFERLASLPGADPASFETAQLAFTPRKRVSTQSLGEKPALLAAPTLVVESSGSKPSLMSYPNQTLNVGFPRTMLSSWRVSTGNRRT